MEESVSEEKSKLDELLDTAEGIKHEIDRKESAHEDVKQDLVNLIEKEEDKFTEDELEQVEEHLEEREYHKVRELYYDVMDRNKVSFDDDELNEISEAFKQEIEELNSTVEKMKNSLTELRTSNYDDDDIISMLYGSTGLNKGTIEDVFDSIDEFNSMDDDIDNLARIVAKNKSSLTLTDTKTVMKKMQEKLNG